LDHLCRVRACVNPAHLEPVTHAENVRRGKVTKADLDAASVVRVSERVAIEPTDRSELIRLRSTLIEKPWCPGDGLFLDLPGQRYRLLADDGESVPYGFCRCGCGNRTPLAKRNEYRRGHVKGEPIPVLHGHNRRARPPHYRVVHAGYESPCYLWNRGLTGDGYAQTSFGRSNRLVHRLAYETAKGTVPKGLELHHLCENRDCIRPDHMVPLTHAEHARMSSYAKLTMQAAREIRASTHTVANLASQHGVSSAAICDVRGGRHWNEAIL
jgi:hypothetical protein